MQHYRVNDSRKFISSLIEKIRPICDKTSILAVANLKDEKGLNDDSKHDLMSTEFFNEQELEEIVSSFRKNGISIKIYTDEMDFISEVCSKKYEKFVKHYNIVYNTAQRGNGPGRKSLIPAFCNLNNIPIISSNAYVVSLCRHKYHYNKLLKQHGISVVDAWLFLQDNSWLANERPAQGVKVIIKPIYESASIGVSEESILSVDENLDKKMSDLSIKFKQPMIVQRFIEGFEFEVPIICDSLDIRSLRPVGIALNGNHLMGQQILTYNIVFEDKYEFYDPEKSQNVNVESMMDCAKASAKIIGIEGLGRIDFRVNENGDFFITDISTSPHIVKHSSFAFRFNQLGFDYDNLPLTLLAASGNKYGWFS